MSERPDFKGDYMGFTYNGTHSSELGIVRISDGSRFNENLLPTMQDKTVQVPGGDGTYYFGSYYTQRQFSVSFAFDSLTEEQLARLKRHFGDKGIHDLVFDENPYKVYSAKVTGTATIKHIPFNEGAGKERVYKGEGTIQFTCYNPFARSRFKWLNEYVSNTTEGNYKPGKYCVYNPNSRLFELDYDLFDENKTYYIGNIIEWAGASGMIKSNDSPANKPGHWEAQRYDTYYQYRGLSQYGIVLYNPGDRPADFILFIPFNSDGKIVGDNLRLWKGENQGDEYLTWKGMDRQKDRDAYIGINSRLNLIEGYDSSFNKSGSIYNKFITGGAFFKIPNDRTKNMSLWFMYNQANGNVFPTIKYDYVYF